MENTTIKFETEPIDNVTLLKLLGRPTTLADIDELIAVQGDEEAHFIRVVYCKDCKHYSADGWGYGNCYRRSVEYLRMADNGFCSFGERIEDEQIH